MFTDKFSGYAGESIECERGGIRFVATLYADDDATPPWGREDGHGPVSDWTRDSKLPGQLILSGDRRGWKRLYDFAEACRIARREGWGYLPGEMATWQDGEYWFARCDGVNQGLPFRADDVKAAIRAVYAAHRATMTPRQYAAAAAMADYDRLRKWCDDQWSYVGVAVQAFADDVPLTGEYDHALSGIESDAGEYLTETACELLDECETAAKAAAVAMATKLAALA